MTPDRDGFTAKWLAWIPETLHSRRHREFTADLDALLAAERERCAQVADTMAAAAETTLRVKHDDDAACQFDTANLLAAAIRAGGKE